MGVWFNDPDVEMDDIFWYHVLTKAMHNSLALNEGFVSNDDELGTMSCYVVLHRNGYIGFSAKRDYFCFYKFSSS